MAPAEQPPTTPEPVEVPTEEPSADPNSAPVLDDPTLQVTGPAGGAPVTVDLARGASDADGDRLFVQSAALARPAHGTVVLGPRSAPTAAARAAAPTTITYTPDRGWRGTDTVRYVLSDGNGGTVRGEVAITTPNTAPVAAADTAAVLPWAPGTPEASYVDIAVLANDRDPNRDALRVTGVTDPAHGTAQVVRGRVRYRPDRGFHGDRDTFRYTVTDRHGGTATASVTVTVAAFRALVAADDEASTAHGTPVTVDVLANDTGVGPLHIVDHERAVAGGSVVETGDGLRFVPADGFSGPARFSYTVQDGLGRTDTATVLVTVEEPGAPSSDATVRFRRDGASGHLRVTVDGIPPGASAALEVRLSGVTAVLDDGGCTASGSDGDVTLSCEVTAATRTIRLRVDGEPTGRATITPVGFEDPDPGNNTSELD